MSGKPGPHHKTAKTAKLPKMSHRYLTWGAARGLKPSKKVSAAQKLGHKKKSLGTMLQRIRGESAAEERTMSDAQKTTMKGDLKDRLSGVLALVSEADSAGKKPSSPTGNGSSKPKAMPELEDVDAASDSTFTSGHYHRLMSAAVGAVHSELATMGLLESGGQVDVSPRAQELVLEAVQALVSEAGVIK